MDVLHVSTRCGLPFGLTHRLSQSPLDSNHRWRDAIALVAVAQRYWFHFVADRLNRCFIWFAYQKAMHRQIKAFIRDESGATAIEYSLIAGAIALAIIAVTKGVGTKLNTTFSSVSTQLK
jgi:pilus assembly protein Flp/PilA